MGNPNSFGGGDEIDGQVGMDEWVKNNEDQEISSRVEGNLHTISQAQSLELLDSFESQIKDAEGKLDELDRMRRSREFEMMRNAIAARRAELTPNNVTEAVSEDISISNEDINDASVDVAETSNYGGIDDRTLADIATSPDVGEESRTAAMREVERRETEGTFDIDNPVYKKGEWSDFDGISDDELLDMATSPDVDPRLSEAAEAELKRRETEAGSDEIIKSSSNEDVGSHNVGEPTDEVVEAKEDNSEEIEESVGMTNESAEKDNDREERIKRNKEIFENALHKINECTDLDKLASWRKNLEEGFAKLDPAVQEKTLERHKEIMRAIDDRMEAPELNLRKYRAWQTGQMMEYKGLSDEGRERFKGKIAEEEDFSGINWDNDILTDGFGSKTGDDSVADSAGTDDNPEEDTAVTAEKSDDDSAADSAGTDDNLGEDTTVTAEKSDEREDVFNNVINSDDENVASMARREAINKLRHFFSDGASRNSGEDGRASDNLDSKVDRLLNPDIFYKSDEGLRVLFTGSRSYYDAIETLESAYLEGKTFDEVSSILDTVLSERGEEGKSRVLRKRLKRRYETLGINEDGTLNSEKSEKVSWRKRTANAIRKVLKMEVE